MSQNQLNKTYENSLLALRQEIDKIDEDLLSSLQKRMAVVERVADLKKQNQEKFFIRSNREADMIKNLIDKSQNSLPKNLIINLWRKIITAANMHEQPLRIAIHNENNCAKKSALVAQYYNEFVPLFNFDSPTKVIAALQKNEAEIAIFEIPNSNSEEKRDDQKQNWWISLANNKDGFRVFAIIPFYKIDGEENGLKLVAVAAKKAEKSSSDFTLICVEASREVTKSQILSELKKSDLAQKNEIKILKSAETNQIEGILFHLVEIAGFVEDGDEILQNFMRSKIKPYARVLGHYAAPIKID